MKVVWLSANLLGYELLKKVIELNIETLDLQAIITLSQKAKTVMYDGIEIEKWYGFNRKVIEVEKVNEEKALIEYLCPDLIIMCGWRQIVDKNILSIPRKGVVGFHPTLLPYGRGAAPIINTILSGKNKSGLTMFYVSDKVDAGDIIGQEAFPIEPSDHAADVYEKTIRAGKNLVRKYIPLLVRGKTPRVSQDEKKAVVFSRPGEKINKINFKKDGLELVSRKIRALSKPYRGAYVEVANKKLIIWRAELQEVK